MIFVFKILQKSGIKKVGLANGIYNISKNDEIFL